MKSLSRLFFTFGFHMTHSAELAAKSVQAAVAAIEIYNKPSFSYREEAFALLMSNAWELLLKAKWLLNHSESIDCLYVFKSDGKGGKVPKTNSSGNTLTQSASYLCAKLKDDKGSGLELACHDNFLALVAIRDTAAHFINKDLYLSRRVLEIGKRLLDYLDALEQKPVDMTAKQQVALQIETKLVRAKDLASIAFRWTDDPTAPAIIVREEDIFKNYPMTYRVLTETLKKRYKKFLENRKYHEIRRDLEKDKKYAIVRLLDPTNANGSRKSLYSSNILPEFDKYYT